MGFYDEMKVVLPDAPPYVTPTPEPGSWRDRFLYIEAWADSNPWDSIAAPKEKDLKLCIRELYDAIHMANEGFKFCAAKNGSTEALTAALGIARILA